MTILLQTQTVFVLSVKGVLLSSTPEMHLINFMYGFGATYSVISRREIPWDNVPRVCLLTLFQLSKNNVDILHT